MIITKRTLFLWVGLSFVTPTVFAQTSTDTLVASQYYKKADSLLTDKKHEESIKLFNKALPEYKKAKAWEKVASCYNKISENQWRSRKLEKSLEYAKKAIDICTKHFKKDHPEEANAYDNIGKYYLNKATYNNVLSNYQKALTIRKKLFPEYHPDITKSYVNIAIFYCYTGNNQKAIPLFKKVLSIYKALDPEHDGIKGIYNDMGIAYQELEKYDTALILYKKFLSITIKNKGENHPDTAYSYINIGSTYRKLKQLDLALEYYKKALLICKKENNTRLLVALYTNMGIIFGYRGENNKALQYYKKALNVKLKKYTENHPVTADIYHNMGVANKSIVKKSLSYHNKALQIYKIIYGEDHFKVAISYSNLGSIYSDEKEFDTALTYLYKSLKIKKNILDKNHSGIALSYKNIGDLYKDKKTYAVALDYFQKSLGILQNSSAKHYDLTSSCYNSIGETYYKQQNYSASLASFDKALQCNTKKDTPKTSKESFDPKDYHFLEKLFETLLGKAKTLQERYKRDEKTNDLDQSISLYQNLDLLVDHLRLSYQNYNDKVNLAEQAKEMYADAVAVQLKGYKDTNDFTMLEKALYYAGKSKSNILKDLLHEVSAKGFAGLPEQITRLEKTLKSNRAFYQSQIVTAQSKDSVDIAYIKEYENKLFEVSRRQDSLTQLLEQNYPKYYQLKHKNDIISVADIQQKLSDNTTVLEFFANDSITYAFTISKNTIVVKELTTHNLAKKVAALYQSIITENIRDYKELAHDLYQELIAPTQDKLIGDQLIIIPDGPLWHLNFDLLLTENKPLENTENLPYLLRNYAISYSNSANLLFNPVQKSSKLSEIRNECLAFSFSDSTKLTKAKTMSLATLRDTGDDLPGTRKEIKAISNIVNGQYYYGSEAIEANFKQNAGQYSILHLALHGDVDHKNPQNSKLYFTKNKDTIEDNYLYSHELFALDIPAELAVLSACNTGAGTIAKGEGIMSLGNAFQYAGTKSLLLSGWEVSDKSAPVLIENFYKNLANGMNKAKALQKAKLDFLKTANFDQVAPFYWGSFYLLGNADPIDIDQPMATYIYWIIFACIFIVLALIFLYYKKRSRR